ncbi:MAG: VCBS repeat-containing protein, partial [Alphaproteobacteria bacterium]|nr:VCBS repeat-containing protein [Alphaproteobacteria bacterium]
LPLENYRLKTTTAFDNYDVYKLKLDQGFYHQFMQNTLQLNTGNNNFKEISQYAGIEASDWSWGALMFDADNDGYNDIYVCNGIKHDLTNQDFLDFLSNDIIKQMVTSGVKDDVKKIIEKMPITPIINKMYHNQGDFTFKDVATNWGMQLPSFSNGAAYADLDNDGDLDLIVNNLNAKAFVFKNNAEKNSNNHFFKCYLHFNPKNKFAIGAKIKIFQDNHIYFREQFPTRGFQSSVDYGVVTGIGTSKKIDSVIIEWPNLQKSVYKSIKADSVYQFSYQTESSYKIIAAPQLSKPHFTEIENNFPVMHENDHIDFYIERGIPKMLSKESPKSAVADVNRDGLLDIYITNTNKTNGGLYLQQKNTTFKKMVQPCFANDKHLEETTVTFFDANGDGFADLFIGCGGNHRAPQEGYYSIKLFLNNGKGQFLEQIDALPQNTNNISTCLAFDYDNDGDLDLFIGSRSVPLIYGQKPTNLLLNNNGHGVFKDVSSQEGLALQNIGMITSAQFGNIFNNKKQLVIVGEWMQPHFFEFDKHVFNKVKTNLDSCSGWWQHLEIADMNNDGHLDLIIGNIGENFYLRPTNHSPVILWLKDFDENGTIDKIITKQIEGNDYTVLLKRDLDQQLPSLKKQNLKFESFARKTMQELFNPNQLAQTEKLYFNYGASIVAYNQGHYDFKIEKLPPDIQFSSLNAFVIQDFNGDGLLDLLSAGNQLYFVPQFGRLDGSYGGFVLNQNGLLTNVVSEKESGLHIIGQINDIKQISSSPQPLFIFLRNNLKPVVLKYSY